MSPWPRRSGSPREGGSEGGALGVVRAERVLGGAMAGKPVTGVPGNPSRGGEFPYVFERKR